MNNEKNTYHKKLRDKMDEYVHLVYRFTRNFPREELYGTTSQFRRSALSVILNYIEGFARIRKAVQKNFLEISYGSLKESKYLLEFSLKEKYLSKGDYDNAIELAEEIGAMLWGILRKL
ncbi:four helix bundle protein [Candidatus Wolfebacteria bacterium]|nr:four helix bundle protein [Candidatus Wolfebacteria bacterium]